MKKYLKNIYQIIALIIFLFGVAFGIIAAVFDGDLPGYIFPMLALIPAAIIHALGEIVFVLKDKIREKLL
jgi:hypothetical protein